MRFLNAPLHRIASFQEADRMLKEARGPVQLLGCAESQKVHIMSQAGGEKTRLIVTYDEREARSLLEDCKLFSRNVLFFPAKDLLFYQADIKSNTIARERMQVMRQIREAGDEPFTIVTTMAAMMNTLAPFEQFEAGLIELSEGASCETEAIVIKLVSLGYERVARVEAPGEFTVHGGILDIYDMTAENPYRVEFWDTEIDTIREFSADTQKSMERRESITIYPATELFLNAEQLAEGRKRIEKDYKKNKERFLEKDDLEGGAALQSMMREVTDELNDRYLKGQLERFMPYFFRKLSALTDYLPADTLIFLEEPQRMQDYGTGTEEEFMESFRIRLEKGMALPEQGSIMRTVRETMTLLATGRTMVFTGLDTMLTGIHVNERYSIDCQPLVSFRGNVSNMMAELKRCMSQKYSVVLFCPSRTRGSRMAEELRENGIKAYYDEDSEREVEPGTMLVTHGNLHRGFLYPQLKFMVMTEGDIFGGEKKKRSAKKKTDSRKALNFSELSVNDYVVHESYGIGIYQGVVKMTADDVDRDYMKISYGKSGTLYIPVTNLDVVQKYASADAKPPRLNKLDSPDWKKTKTRVRAAVQEVAEELVSLYASRQNGTGYVYSPDTVWQKEFEELFPYEETQDQLDAIDAVKADMESGKIMDRLICGDVGFGKTEVAIRAAFKAVQDGKQVAYLVPTTILAQQHFNTFTQRMQEQGTQIELMSRFRTPEQIRSSISRLKRGTADIVIGTHRILSKDVEFKDLGLLIIDEEQRFGVKHKEQIKQLKNNVDVLTLTATPIPRTLHMSMIGVRDMSVLSEAPTDRQAIQTYVMEYSEELVREAISRELARDGQVYYVYNRVSDIQEVTAKVQALVPDATVAFAHGKMSEHELERVMLAFIEGEIDVLVSTTIIETGLDIPNVNTIIVHDAERYGLSQLYQLRGRVGRSNRQAYAFIMYRKNHALSEETQKRLEAIRQFTELGSGVKIAMQDLEIRGAGAVLGNAQSGHMTLVGYDLYCKMLSEAVKKARGDEDFVEDFDTILDIRVDAYIPESYIGQETLKLEIYKKISFIMSDEDKESLTDELIDRFGELPRQTENLMEVALLRNMARSVFISEVKGNAMELKFKFVPFARVKTENLPVLLEKMKGAMRFLPGETPGLLWHRLNLKEAGKADVLTTLKVILLEIKGLLI